MVSEDSAPASCGDALKLTGSWMESRKEDPSTLSAEMTEVLTGDDGDVIVR